MDRRHFDAAWHPAQSIPRKPQRVEAAAVDGLAMADRQRAEDAEATASIAIGEGIAHEEILREFSS